MRLSKLAIFSAFLLCGCGEFLLISGLAEREQPQRIIVALLMILPIAMLLVRARPNGASGSRRGKERSRFLAG